LGHDVAVTQPGIPAFVQTPEPPPIKGFPTPPPQPPPKVKSPTLEFNFDDMVKGSGASSAALADKTKDMTIDDTLTGWDKSNPGVDVSKILAGEGGGFDIIATPPPQPKPRSAAQLREEVATLLSGAKDLLDLDDHSGAMELINKALELDPADAGALKLKDRSERTLQAMFESKLGDLNQLPRVKLKEDEIIWLNLDHRAGFVLAQIDGSVTFEDLFAVSGMSRIDTARILAQLVEEGVISKS
jgi:CRP-like cAMP-binding protein